VTQTQAVVSPSSAAEARFGQLGRRRLAVPADQTRVDSQGDPGVRVPGQLSYLRDAECGISEGQPHQRVAQVMEAQRLQPFTVQASLVGCQA
jgi:hypothetical protein